MEFFSNAWDVFGHPQAELLGYKLINTCFNGVLSESQLSMLEKGVDIIGLAVFQNLGLQAKQRLLTCALLSKNPPQSKVNLLVWARENLGLSDKVMAWNAFLSNDAVYINEWLSYLSDYLLKFICMGDNKLIFEVLVKRGLSISAQEILNYSISDGSRIKDLFQTTDFQVFFRFAGENGQLELLKYFEIYLNKAERKIAIKANTHSAVTYAATNGHLTVVEYLLSQLNEAERKDAVQLPDFSYFCFTKSYSPVMGASRNGHIHVLVRLLSELDSVEIKEAIRSVCERTNNPQKYSAVIYAVEHGNLLVIEYLLSHLDKVERKTAIKRSYSAASTYAAKHGRLEVLKYFNTLLNEVERNTLIEADNYSVFQDSVIYGHLNVIKYLLAQHVGAVSSFYKFFARLRFVDKERKSIIKLQDYAVIRYAAENGHLDVLKYFEAGLIKAERKAAIKARNHQVVIRAAKNGHFAIVKHLLTQLDDVERKSAVSGNDVNYRTLGHCSAFIYTAKNGDLDVLKYLFAQLNEVERQVMVKHSGYSTVIVAAENGHLAVIQHLIVQLSEVERKAAIKRSYNAASQRAAINGHLDVIEYFNAQLDKEEIKSEIKLKDYSVIISAARRKNLPVIEYFFGYLGKAEIRSVIKANNYGAFRAVSSGHLAIVQYFELQLNEEEIKNAIQADNYSAFRAASSGHLAVVQSFELQLNEEEIKNAIQADNYSAIRNASRFNNYEIVEHFLKHKDIFAYMESHDEEYGQKHTYSYVYQKLKSIADNKANFEQQNPNGVFDIENNDAEFYFYMLRNLIRRGVDREYAWGEACLVEIQLLLSIPAVRNLCHTRVNNGQENELLRLALSTGNRAAAEILLTVPAVHALAVEDDFYRDEAHGRLDLNALARDGESSMTALTPGEKKRLDAALKLYQPVIEERGINSLMTVLRDLLISRYKANPARVTTGDGRVIDLPSAWSEWSALSKGFSADTREQALKSYAQHKEHSAWRYLEKPNPWMDENAPYVNRGRRGLYSTFEGYQPLIVMFFLGASDKSTTPCDGYTFETRIEHFIDELAYIGRAHNWDNTRIKTNDSDEPVVDEFGGVINEEYDDLMGDKPSCYSGVKRRLFQSVQGHPLLKMLTMDDLKQELREVVREHFRLCIQVNPKAAIEWKKHWGSVCETGFGGEVLSSMDLPEEAQAAFIEALGKKYPAQFGEDLSFKAYIQERFKLNKQVTTHAARFGGETDLKVLLEPCVDKKQLNREKLASAAESRAKRTTHTIFRPAEPSSSSDVVALSSSFSI